MARLLKYAIAIVLVYLAVTAFFANRIDNEYFSVVVSDGWSMSQDTEHQGKRMSGSFVNKNTQTVVEYHVGPSTGLEEDLTKFFSPIVRFGSTLLQSDLKMGETQQGNGFSFAKYTKGANSGIVLFAHNNYGTVTFDICGPQGYADGVAFVNNFFNTDKTLFPEFIDPEIAGPEMNLHILQHKIKTIFHSYINPKELTQKVVN